MGPVMRPGRHQLTSNCHWYSVIHAAGLNVVASVADAAAVVDAAAPAAPPAAGGGPFDFLADAFESLLKVCSHFCYS